MSRRSWQDRIRDIIDAIDEIARFTDGYDHDAFLNDEKTIKAVLADFQIIGEATAHVPESVQATNPEIPWRFMRQMRNIIVHAYFAVEPGIVWQTIQDDLPRLRQQLHSLLSNEHE